MAMRPSRPGFFTDGVFASGPGNPGPRPGIPSVLPQPNHARMIRRLTARVKKLESVIQKSAQKEDATPKRSSKIDADVEIITADTDSDSSSSSSDSDDDHNDDNNNNNQTNEWGSVVYKVKFFDSAGELERADKMPDFSRRKGSYQCRIDPKHLIRVLYNWADGSEGAQPLGDGAPDPDPEDIEVLALGVMSEPVAAFFRTRLGLDCGPTDLVRLSRPFRPLIRNMTALREELSRLETKDKTDQVPLSVPEPTKPKKAGDAVSDASSSPILVANTPDVSDDVSEGASESPSENTNKAAARDASDAARHFRMLIDFADKYLAKQLRLYDRIQLGREDKVSFEDLWMLFDAGMTVYAPTVLGGSQYGSNEMPHVAKTRHLPQLFAVQTCGGGLPLRSTALLEQDLRDDALVDKAFAAAGLSRSDTVDGGGGSGDGAMGAGDETAVPDDDSPSSSSSRRNGSYSHLHVICFNIDYNGTRYGIVHECFSFKPYDGLRDIRELQVYPVRYMSSASGDSEDFFLARGRKFMGLTAATHMSYEGLTVGDSPEEINSAVVVDIKMAFQEYRRELPDQANAVPIFRGLAYHWIVRMASEPFEFCRTSCKDVWCCRHPCVSDAYLNATRARLQRKGVKVSARLEELAAECARQGEQQRGLQKLRGFMEDNDLVRLLPGVVPAFALRNRRWVILELDKLREVPRGNGWKNLVLPKGHRTMVQAMVETHAMGSRTTSCAQGQANDKVQVDLVQGKGRGCVILLHGVPGVGKTSTAECVAAHTRRPLYQLTCGDIGYLPEDVERSMEKHFKLAHAWGCVLLLDEADVFLAKRNKTDVKRNGLVSVFLRILEYYPGILFLTTNRVGAIDDAFRSRLHMMLYYPRLSEKDTGRIWRNNLRRIHAFNRERAGCGRPPIRFDEANILAWARANYDVLQWNGRQIRNAVQTAVALAEYRAKQAAGDDQSAPVMRKSDFHLVASASIKFSEYMDETVGQTEDAYAAREKIRPTAFTSKARLKMPESDSEGSEDESGSDSGEAAVEHTPTGGSDSSDSDEDDFNGDDSDESDDDREQRKKKVVKSTKKETALKKDAKASKHNKKKGKKAVL